MTAMETLRKNVVRKRAEKSVSQSTLADRAGVSRPTISKIEQGDGNVTVAILERIATVLGCTLEQLFERDAELCDELDLTRRANAPDSEFVDGRALLAAIDEANESRFSRRGRRRAVDRQVASGSRKTRC